MELEKQVCSLELAKRLKELGVKQQGAFSWYCYDHKGHKEEYVLRGSGGGVTYRSKMYQAYTVAELGEMLPPRQWGSDNKGPKSRPYRIWWSSAPVESDWVAAAEADARAKMLIYLLENKLIAL